MERLDKIMITFVIVVGVSCSMALLLMPFGSVNLQRISGEKIGIFTKINEQGTIYRTHEGQIIRGGINQGSGSFGQTFDFTIPDEMLLNAHNALDSQKEVKIYYSQPFWCWRMYSENNC